MKIFPIALILLYATQVWSGSVPSYEKIKNCKCVELGQAHFFKDPKNNLEIQISKGECICDGQKKEVTAVCPSKNHVRKKLINCAEDSTMTAEMLTDNKSQPTTPPETTNDSQGR